MTEKLYYQNAYTQSFEARVVSTFEENGKFVIALDRTAFFPEEGGQYSDTGTIDGARVEKVVENAGVIYHYVDSFIEENTYVFCKIDFDQRYEKMQSHTAEHILSGLIHKKYGLDNVGFHLGAEDVTLDISAPLSREEIFEIERLANEAVYANVKVDSVFPTKEELPSMTYRSKLDITENVRIVNIGEYDSCACCAPHVNYTGEIGLIIILDFEKLRGGMRIHIAAGRRAYRIYKNNYENLSTISHALSVPRSDTADAVNKMLSDFEQTKFKYKSARALYFEREADFINSSDGNLLFCFEDATQEEMRIVANKATSKVGKILVLLSGNDGNYKYLLSSERVDLRVEVQKINAALSGRGGGSSSMVQGSFFATLDQIKGYFI